MKYVKASIILILVTIVSKVILRYLLLNILDFITVDNEKLLDYDNLSYLILRLKLINGMMKL